MEIWFLKLLWVRFWASSTHWWEFQLCCCTAQLLGQFWPQASNISIQSFAGKTSIFTFTKWPLTWWHYLGVKRNQQIFRRRRPCPPYRLIPWATLRSTTLQSGPNITTIIPHHLPWHHWYLIPLSGDPSPASTKWAEIAASDETPSPTVELMLTRMVAVVVLELTKRVRVS